MRGKIFWIIIFILLVTNLAQAAFEIPVLTPPETAVRGESIEGYIVRLYWFAVGAAGILAVGVIVFGAIYYMVSAGNSDKQRDARSYITSALWGVALLLGSYLILNTINPQITALRPPAAADLPEFQQTLPVCAVGQRPCGIGQTPARDGCVRCREDPTSVGAVYLECPEPTHTECFFNPSRPSATAACDFQDPGRVICTAKSSGTPACNGSKPFPEGITNCTCPSCQVIPVGFETTINDNPPKFPIRTEPQVCSYGRATTLGVCFLNGLVRLELVQMLREVIRDGAPYALRLAPYNGWRITEAFPPINQHHSPCHYRGTCFDFSRSPIPGPDDPGFRNFCNQLQVVINSAARRFDVVLIESAEMLVPLCLSKGVNINLPASARVTTGAYSTGFHIHIDRVKR